MRAWMFGVLMLCSTAMGAGEFQFTTDADVMAVGAGFRVSKGISIGSELLLLRDPSTTRDHLAIADSFLGIYATIPLARIDNNPLIPLPAGSILRGRVGGYYDLGGNDGLMRLYGGIVDIPLYESLSLRVRVERVNNTAKIDDTITTVGFVFGF